MEISSGHQQSRDDGQRVEGEAAHGRACSDLGSLEEASGRCVEEGRDRKAGGKETKTLSEAIRSKNPGKDGPLLLVVKNGAQVRW